MALDKDEILGKLADKLKAFTPQNPITVLDYTDTNYTESIGFRAALKDESAMAELLVRLPDAQQPNEKLQVERAIVYQARIAHERQDESREFWDALLAAYTRRDKKVISYEAGLGTLAGLGNVKSRLWKQVITPYLTDDLKAPHFVLFDGPPGCGKTVTAKKLAEEIGYRYIQASYVGLAGTKELSYGAMAQKIASQLSDAVKQAPCVLFFDEFSSLGRPREDSYSGNDASVTTETILQELDKIKEHNQKVANIDRRVLVVGAFNYETHLDEAIGNRALRVTFTAPDKQQLVAIAEQKLEEAFQHYEIQNVSNEMIQKIATDIAEATVLVKGKSARNVETIATSIARTSSVENNGNVTPAIIRQEITSELEGKYPEGSSIEDEAWKSLLKGSKVKGSFVTGAVEGYTQKWLKPYEEEQMERLLPDTQAFKESSIVNKGMFHRLYDHITQNKLEFAITTIGIVGTAITAAVSLLAVSGVLPITALILINPVIQGLQGVVAKLALQSKSNYLKDLQHEFEGTAQQVNQLFSESRGGGLPIKFGSLRFGAGENRSPKASKALDNEIDSLSKSSLNTQTPLESLENLKNLTSLLGSKINNPKFLLSLAEEILNELGNLLEGVEGGADFIEKAQLTRIWLCQYYNFKSDLPENAQKFGDLPGELRQQYRELLFKGLNSQIPPLVSWAQAEAKRLGYSPENIQQIIALNH